MIVSFGSLDFDSRIGMIDNHLYNRYNQHRLDHHLHHYFHSRELQLDNRPWLSEVDKSEQAEYYELVGSIDNDHLPDNSFQFHLVVFLEPDPSVELKSVDMMNQPGYERWDILDGVFVMP